VQRSLVIVACVVLMTVAAAAQFGGSPLIKPPEGATTRAATWVDAVLAHEPAMADAATLTLGDWTGDQVSELLIELSSIRLLMRDPDTTVFPVPIEFDTRFRGDPRVAKEISYSRTERDELRRAAERARLAGLDDVALTARAIVLHSDIALRGGVGNSVSHTDGQSGAFEYKVDHWRMARDLSDQIRRRDGRDADLIGWYRATLATMAATQLWNAAHISRAIDRFPDDADLQLLAGCLHEMAASARTQAAVASVRLPPGAQMRIGSPRGELGDAASRLKRALELRSAHAEARLHYGRVLTLLGRASNAVPELRSALAEAGEPEQRYYAQLFLGRALEGVNQPQPARAAYEAAAALFPRAQAPYLALSQMAAAAANSPAAAAALAPLFALPAVAEDRQDPWWTYFRSCGRQAEDLLTAAYAHLAPPRRAGAR
jgi:hypothetical protein